MLELQEMQVRTLGWEDSLEKEMAMHSSFLAWDVPWTDEPDWLAESPRPCITKS